MKKIFTSGSCRILTTVADGREKVEPIHSLFKNFTGINFFGKLHNTKQHIQFIRWIHDEIQIPNIHLFLTTFIQDERFEKHGKIDNDNIEFKKNFIKNNYKICDYYIFEISSLKLYQRDGFQVQCEIDTDCDFSLQTIEDLYNDLKILRNLVPGKLIFQTHFRPQIICNKAPVTNREIIYETVDRFCREHDNTFLHDPSLFLMENTDCFDGDKHFNEEGYAKHFEYILQKFDIV